MAFGANNRVTGWRLIGASGKTLVEYIEPQEIPLADNDPTQRKVDRCRDNLERCRIMAHLKPPPLGCFASPFHFAECLFALDTTFEDELLACVAEFEKCVAA